MLDVLTLMSLVVSLSVLVSALIGIYSLIKIPNEDRLFRYAGFWRRAIAAIVDTIVMITLTMVPAALVGFLVGLIFAGSMSRIQMEMVGQGIGAGIGALAAWLYFAKMESSRHQATFGKMLLGLRVVDTDGKPIGFGQATARHFAKVLSFLTLYIGIYMMGWTKRKQGLHDKISGCLVVRKDSPALIGFQGRQAATSADRDRLDRALSKPPVSPMTASTPPKPPKSTMSDRILARLDADPRNSR